MRTTLYLAAMAIPAITAPLTAQRTLHSHQGPDPQAFHGFAVADIGDVDADGIADYAIGASNAPVFGRAGSGRVDVHSGATGRLLYTTLGPGAGARFGWAIAAIGDVDVDGVPDFAVGAPFDSAAGFEAGSVTAFSGASGRGLWRVQGTPGDGRLLNGAPVRFGGRLGTSLAGIDDLDGDGVPDLAAGEPSYSVDPTRNQTAQVCLIDGRIGAPIVRIGFGSSEQGFAMTAVPDLNGDGRRELVVAAPATDTRLFAGAGVITVYTPTMLPRPGLTQRLRIEGSGDRFHLGRAIACPGDLNGDGFPELICHGGLQDSLQATAPARVEIRSLRNGVLVRSHGVHPGETRYGRALTGLGDWNGDGVPEYAVGADRANGNDGLVDVFDGATCNRIRRVGGRNGERLGFALAGIGDIDGDGRRELLAGAVFASAAGLHAGRADVLSFAPGGSISTYGAACAVIPGDFRLGAEGTAALGSPLTLRSGPYVRPTPGLILAGLSNQLWTGGSLPFPLLFLGSPCQLLVSPDVSFAVTSRPRIGSPFHDFTLGFTLPTGSGARGLELFFQLVPLDPTAPAGLATSNGVAIRLSWN